MVGRPEKDETPEKYENMNLSRKEKQWSDLWLRAKVGEVGDHVVEDRVLVGSAGFTHPRSLLLLLLLLMLLLLLLLVLLLLLLLLLLVGLLRLVGRVRVATWLLLLLVAHRVAGVGELSVRRVGGVGNTLT